MTTTFLTSDFDFDLPQELIAQTPLPERSASRLLHINVHTKTIFHRNFKDLESLIEPKDLLIFNDTKVIPARLKGQKATGGQVECLIERILNRHEAIAHLKASKAPKAGSKLFFADGKLEAEVLGREDDLFHLTFLTEQPLLEMLTQYGSIPLPSYITRTPDLLDTQRYQTVYAKKTGAVAAPTAGLHFDNALLEKLNNKGVAINYVTLHVGAGTFQPVRVEELSQHIMHSEFMQLTEETCQAVNNCRQRGGRVIAVGTTSVRCLETAAKTGKIQPYEGETNLFIYPGYQFSAVDALITNFHLPKSSLLMLVSAFAGHAFIMQAYRQAITEKYRFFSYGDAMFIDKGL